ncbi:hypothetical protein [Caudoviricetes sp.]|nr:hypothetical protein [Caudoviricetes sp.]
MADITVQFSDGTSHVYKNAPDSITQDDVLTRAGKDFSEKTVTHLDKKPSQKSLVEQIPVEPGADTATQKEPKRSVADVIRGVIETPLAIGANLATGPLAYLSGAAGPDIQRKVIENIQYQPRTQTARDVIEMIGRGFEASKLPPFMPQMVALQPSVQQSGVRQVAATQAAKVPTTINEVIDSIRQAPKEQQMIGMGAANSAEDLQRIARAQQLRVPVELTKGQATRQPGIQAFESQTAKIYPETVGQPLIQRQAETNRNILSNFDAYTTATGSEMSGLLRPVGKIVDAALVKEAKDAINKVDVAYKNARASGETKALVGYDNLTNYINEQGPTLKEKLAPILGAVEDQLKKNDPNGVGKVSIDSMEEIYQFINKNALDGANASQGRELKNLINQATEGAGGDMYKKARQLRVQYAKKFENAASVDKLLSNKPGTTDRKVAFEDVFDHVILKGSFDDTRNVALLLKKGGDQGQQAWKELQGQTIEYIKDQAIKSIQRDANGNPIVSPAALNKVIRDLDADGKLDYIFGKKGASEIRDLRDVAIDVYSAVPGTVNYSNTSSSLIRAIEQLNKTPLSRIPGVGAASKYIEESATQKALRKQVEESLKYQP